MLTETETSAPAEEAAPQESVVTESPSATALSHLPSPVNQFLQSFEGHISDNVNAKTMDAHEPGPCQTVSASAAPQSPETCDEFKENHPTNKEGSSLSKLADAMSPVESTSPAVESPNRARAEAVTNEATHIMELQQQLSIAKRVTDEQHSMTHNLYCLSEPVPFHWPTQKGPKQDPAFQQYP